MADDTTSVYVSKESAARLAGLAKEFALTGRELLDALVRDHALPVARRLFEERADAVRAKESGL